jgi:hypothetical protein
MAIKFMHVKGEVYGEWRIFMQVQSRWRNA